MEERRKEEGRRRGRTEGGDEMCIPQRGCDLVCMCIFQNYWEVS